MREGSGKVKGLKGGCNKMRYFAIIFILLCVIIGGLVGNKFGTLTHRVEKLEELERISIPDTIYVYPVGFEGIEGDHE